MSEEEEYVTKHELSHFAQVLKDRFDEFHEEIQALRAELSEAKPSLASLYRCSEEGCEYVTDSLRAYVLHTVGEELEKAEEEATPRKHRSVAEFLDCPECFPNFEKVLLEKGWKKPEPERRRKSAI